MTPVVRVCALLAILVIGPRAVADQRAAKGRKVVSERYDWVMEQYESGRFADASQKLSREREGTHGALVGLLKGSDPHDVDYRRLIELLKDMRSKDAVLPLVRNVTVSDGVISFNDPLWRYPAAGALAEIGQPAVRFILRDRARLPATEHELRIFAAVVYHHYADPPLGRCHIELMLKRAQDELDRQGERKKTRSVTWHENLTQILEFYDAAERDKLRLGPAAGEQEKAGAPGEKT